MLGKNVSIILLFVLLAVSSIHCLIACQKNSCDIVKCAEETAQTCNKPNQDLRKGGFCGCCTICYTTLDENEKCSSLKVIGGPAPTSGCKEGLKCIQGKCTKEQ